MADALQTILTQAGLALAPLRSINTPDQAVAFFSDARAKGQVPDLDPTQMVFSVVGAVGLYFTHHAVIQDVLGADPLSPEQVEKRRMEVIRMLHAMITNQGQTRG